jgi:hypothetical protein
MHLPTSLLNAKGCASTRMVVVAGEAAQTSREEHRSHRHATTRNGHVTRTLGFAALELLDPPYVMRRLAFGFRM